MGDFFDWCGDYQVGALIDIEPIPVAARVELKTRSCGPQTVKQQLAAFRHLLDWLVTGQVVGTYPAAVIQGPKFSYTQGKTPILTPQEARRLIRYIPMESVVGLRGRALFGLMIHTLARTSAALTMDVKDVYMKQESLRTRLHEKGGKHREMRWQNNLKLRLREYIESAALADDSAPIRNRDTRHLQPHLPWHEHHGVSGNPGSET